MHVQGRRLQAWLGADRLHAALSPLAAVAATVLASAFAAAAASSPKKPRDAENELKTHGFVSVDSWTSMLSEVGHICQVIGQGTVSRRTGELVVSAASRSARNALSIG